MFLKELPLAINDTMGGPNRLRRPEPAARRSGTRAALFWVFALVAGLGTALLIARYMDKRGGGQTVAPLDRDRASPARPPAAAPAPRNDVRVTGCLDVAWRRTGGGTLRPDHDALYAGGRGSESCRSRS